jgi:polysaccharide export outer membrane protein
MGEKLGRLMIVVCLVLGVNSAWATAGEDSTRSASPSVSAKKTARKGAKTIQTAPGPSMEKASPGSDFVIGPDDVLAVNVWKEPEISQTVAVRPDGKISLPLVGEVVASGLTPKQLQHAIGQHLEEYLSDPEVTVIVHEVKSQRVVVVGEVAKPGSYALQTPMTVLDVIAQAGGPLEYAKVKSICILRTGADGRSARLRFNYKEVISGKNLAQNIKLEAHDTVVVP